MCNRSSQDTPHISIPFFIYKVMEAKALFSSENWKVFGTVALSFLFDKHYPIME